MKEVEYPRFKNPISTTAFEYRKLRDVIENISPQDFNELKMQCLLLLNLHFKYVETTREILGSK